MKAQQLSQGCPHAVGCAVGPGVALMPEKIVQDGSFHGQPRRQQIIHLHRDQRGEHSQLNGDPDGSHQRETEQPQACGRGHASRSSL
jgi:hypothetical protein